MTKTTRRCGRTFSDPIEGSIESIRYSLWARAFYQMHKAAQKSHWVIIRALAYKWIRILFRCWQERTPYDELRYLKSLQKSRSPLLQYLAQPNTPNCLNNFTQNY